MGEHEYQRHACCGRVVCTCTASSTPRRRPEPRLPDPGRPDEWIGGKPPTWVRRMVRHVIPRFEPRANGEIRIDPSTLSTPPADDAAAAGASEEGDGRGHGDEFDAPTVCIAHGAFIPCRKDGEHRYTANPFWVKSVRDYQTSTIDGLTWEPAWEAAK